MSPKYVYKQKACIWGIHCERHSQDSYRCHIDINLPFNLFRLCLNRILSLIICCKFLFSAFCCFYHKSETTKNLCKNIFTHIQKWIASNSQCFIYAWDTMVGLVLSIYLPWITAMEFCAKHSQAPFDPGENYQPNKRWTGTVKYHMSIGKEF